MSVLAQVAIDSAKRRFDINVTDEIHRIKKDMQVKENGYPAFWLSIRKDFNHKLINRKLKCPMNNIYRKTFRNAYPDNSTIPFADFFVYHAMDWDKKQAKRIEALIEDFSLNLFQSRIDDETADDDEEYILLKKRLRGNDRPYPPHIILQKSAGAHVVADQSSIRRDPDDPSKLPRAEVEVKQK